MVVHATKLHAASCQLLTVGREPILAGADLEGGCRGCAPPPRDDLPFSNTTGILRKKEKTMWFIGVEVEQETSAPTPKKNPGSAPD